MNALGKFVWFSKEDKIKRLVARINELEANVKNLQFRLKHEINVNAKLMAEKGAYNERRNENTRAAGHTGKP
jgi:hypothetical protein